MKFHFACVSLAALIAAMAHGANAADFSVGGDGSVKDMSPVPATAVPAPVPIMEYKPQWYFRLDAGIGTISEPSISERGYQYGDLINGANGTPDDAGIGGANLRDLDPTQFQADFSNLSTFGGGIGYYLGGGFRLDATIEKRSNDQANLSQGDSWISHGFVDDDGDGNGPGTTPPVYTSDLDNDGVPDDRTTTIAITDRIDVDGTVWMANAYYDLGTHRGFTPYIGAGVGFVWNQIDRTHTTSVTSTDNNSPCDCQNEYSTTSATEANKISLAAAAMVGVSYQISDITSVDVGYRYLYLGGTDFMMSIDGVESRVEIGDQHVHQVRAGLRFDVN